MTPGPRLNIEVEVHAHEGRWWPGSLEHWRQRDGRWEAWVRYSTGVGETRIGWFDAGDLRQRRVSGAGPC